MVKNLLLVFAVFLSIANLYAQETQTINISGVVLDKKTNEPIIGVTIVEKGTTNGTVSDVDGKFGLKVSSNNVVLAISYIGYVTVEQPLGSQTNFSFSLEEETKNLEEVIVTAVSIKREKRQLGYAAQDIKADELVGSQETNIVNAMNAKVAGVQILSSSGSPGAAARIRIRGNSSLTQNNDPLFVIDGIPIDNSGGESTRTLESSNRAIDINPNDIESMSILKGPAATALYGIRAANGAVIITTKKGKAGKTTVSFSSSWGIDMVNKLPELQTKYAGGNNGDTVYFDQRVNRISPGTGNSRSWGPSYDELRYNGVGDKWDDRGRMVLSNDPNLARVTPYDNINKFFVPALRRDNYISVSGGGEKSTYFLSVGNFKQEGIVPNTNYERSSVKFTGTNQVNKLLKLTSSATYTYSTSDRMRKGGNWSSPIVSLFRSPNDFDIANGKRDPITNKDAYLFADGTQRQNAIFDNPYFSVNNNLASEKIHRVIGFLQSDIQPLPWLGIMARIGTDFNHFNDRQNYSKQSAENHAEQSFVGSIRNGQTIRADLNTDLLISADKDISKDFNIGLRIGHNYWQSSSNQLEATGYGYTFSNYEDLTNTQSIETFNRDVTRKIMGIYSEAKLGFRNYLFLTGTFRREEASTLPRKNQSFTYPSLSLSFVFTDVLKLDNNQWLSFGKLRLSVAQVGNLPNPYLTNTFYTRNLSVPFQGQTMYRSELTQGNPNFKPELSTSYEIGTELRFFKNRASIDVTYYDTKSENQIIPIQVAASTGYNFAQRNSGFITNKGLEVVVGITPIKRDFVWDVNLNFFTYQNKVFDVATNYQQIGGSAGFTQGYSGYANGNNYGILIGASRYQRYGQDPNDPAIRKDLPIVVDSAGYPVIQNGTYIIGNPNPDWTLGFRNGFSYKGFSLSALLDIRKGGQVFNLTRLNMMAMGTHKLTENRDELKPFDNSVNKDGSANITSIKQDRTFYENLGGDFGNVPERGIEDGSWIRLREVAFGYSFNEKKVKVLGMQNLSLKFTGRNLFLITPYSGIDPETNAAGNDPSFGRDAYNSPNTKSYVMTLSALF